MPLGNRINRARYEDPFRSIARHMSERLSLSGWRFEHTRSIPKRRAP